MAWQTPPPQNHGKRRWAPNTLCSTPPIRKFRFFITIPFEDYIYFYLAKAPLWSPVLLLSRGTFSMLCRSAQLLCIFYTPLPPSFFPTDYIYFYFGEPPGMGVSKNFLPTYIFFCYISHRWRTVIGIRHMISFHFSVKTPKLPAPTTPF